MHRAMRRLGGVISVAACATGFAAGGGGHGHAEAVHVPSGAELDALCAEYREQLVFTRAQLRERNILGRMNLFKGEHRMREQFVTDHCGDDRHASDSHAGGAHHGADDHH